MNPRYDAPESGHKGSDNNHDVAVLVPCYNEALAIEKVVLAFKACLPRASIYVYDNNSSDGTAEIARRAGAQVRHEQLQGKGNVVRRMFADIDADVYVIVDGDDTYDAAMAPMMVEKLVEEHLDMVNGRRVETQPENYRAGHRFGNVMITKIVGAMCGHRFNDVLSGFKIFSRRFVKSFPVLSSGFEIETELTVHALEMRMPVAEVDIPYGNRPAGSTSKLNTYRDGLRILLTILKLMKQERPLQFFAAIAAVFGLSAIVLAWPLITEYLATGLVPRLPTAVLVTGMMLAAFLSMACGLILESVTHGRREMKRLHYLAVPGPARKNVP